jgi:tetratricopeptide (TPR) repeat protein
MLRMNVVKLPLAIFLALVLSCPLTAQSRKPQHKATTTTARPKLTPQQQTGLSILDQQAGVAKGLSPVMRAFALMEIARGYEKLNQTKALATLRDAFQASQSIEDDSDPKTSSKSWLQGQVVDRLVALDPAYCEQLVPQLAGYPRSAAINRLIMYHTRKKQFAQAIALLGQLGDEEFPYIIGSNLVRALPPEMAADKQNLFAQALASFSRHEHKNGVGMDDFGVFISRTWQGLPPDLVLQAIDEALKQARQSDAKMQITLGAEKGSASFTSIYDYNLFELMPVLHALDPERADRLLQEDRDVQTAAKQYPNGLESLDPENGIPDSITMRLPSNSGESAADDRYEDQLQPQIRQIIAQAEKDPKQALAAAMSLPDFHNTRALALLKLAGVILKTSPGYAANALDELMKIIPSIQRDIVQFDMLAGAGDDYLKLGNTDAAKKVVDHGFKLAGKLYATDTDAGDPNQAFKAMWPSTSAWRRFVSLATRISPQTALQAINSIPDPEIQALETIALADSLLGALPATQMVAIKTKAKNSYMFGVE